MAKDQVEKLIDEAIDTRGLYAEFVVTPGTLLSSVMEDQEKVQEISKQKIKR